MTGETGIAEDGESTWRISMVVWRPGKREVLVDRLGSGE
jgi:hypothetical protein